jgi:hypothetical protein
MQILLPCSHFWFPDSTEVGLVHALTRMRKPRGSFRAHDGTAMPMYALAQTRRVCSPLVSHQY